MIRIRIAMGVTLLLLLAGGASAQVLGTPVAGMGEQVARANLIDTNGQPIGTAEVIQTPTGVVLIRLNVRGLEPGTHAFHIHETGRCTTPDFSSAGGHFAPHGRSHGFFHPEGEHGGDMLNIQVPQNGQLETERIARHVTLEPGAPGYLLDADGSALVIHSGADDYESQPSGDAGSRVACGVIR